MSRRDAPSLGMRVDMVVLQQQLWRGAKFMDDFEAYAKQIGCTVIHDEIICPTDIHERKLAEWWREHT